MIGPAQKHLIKDLANASQMIVKMMVYAHHHLCHREATLRHAYAKLGLQDQHVAPAFQVVLKILVDHLLHKTYKPSNVRRTQQAVLHIRVIAAIRAMGVNIVNNG